MKKFTVVIGDEKIERHENKLDAILSAWEAKMSSKAVRVLDDATCQVIYR